jgi:hypothetical protein
MPPPADGEPSFLSGLLQSFTAWSMSLGGATTFSRAASQLSHAARREARDSYGERRGRLSSGGESRPRRARVAPADDDGGGGGSARQRSGTAPPPRGARTSRGGRDAPARRQPLPPEARGGRVSRSSQPRANGELAPRAALHHFGEVDAGMSLSDCANLAVSAVSAYATARGAPPVAASGGAGARVSAPPPAPPPQPQPQPRRVPMPAPAAPPFSRVSPPVQPRDVAAPAAANGTAHAVVDADVARVLRQQPPPPTPPLGVGRDSDLGAPVVAPPLAAESSRERRGSPEPHLLPQPPASLLRATRASPSPERRAMPPNHAAEARVENGDKSCIDDYSEHCRPAMDAEMAAAALEAAEALHGMGDASGDAADAEAAEAAVAALMAERSVLLGTLPAPQSEASQCWAANFATAAPSRPRGARFAARVAPGFTEKALVLPAAMAGSAGTLVAAPRRNVPLRTATGFYARGAAADAAAAAEAEAAALGDVPLAEARTLAGPEPALLLPGQLRALQLFAAGGTSLLLFGASGTGKTWLLGRMAALSDAGRGREALCVSAGASSAAQSFGERGIGVIEALELPRSGPDATDDPRGLLRLPAADKRRREWLRSMAGVAAVLADDAGRWPAASREALGALLEGIALARAAVRRTPPLLVLAADPFALDGIGTSDGAPKGGDYALPPFVWAEPAVARLLAAPAAAGEPPRASVAIELLAVPRCSLRPGASAASHAAAARWLALLHALRTGTSSGTVDDVAEALRDLGVPMVNAPPAQAEAAAVAAVGEAAVQQERPPLQLVAGAAAAARGNAAAIAAATAARPGGGSLASYTPQVQLFWGDRPVAHRAVDPEDAAEYGAAAARRAMAQLPPGAAAPLSLAKGMRVAAAAPLAATRARPQPRRPGQRAPAPPPPAADGADAPPAAVLVPAGCIGTVTEVRVSPQSGALVAATVHFWRAVQLGAPPAGGTVVTVRPRRTPGVPFAVPSATAISALCRGTAFASFLPLRPAEALDALAWRDADVAAAGEGDAPPPARSDLQAADSGAAVRVPAWALGEALQRLRGPRGAASVALEPGAAASGAGERAAAARKQAAALHAALFGAPPRQPVAAVRPLPPPPPPPPAAGRRGAPGPRGGRAAGTRASVLAAEAAARRSASPPPRGGARLMANSSFAARPMPGRPPAQQTPPDWAQHQGTL